jgi:FkbM family methyltransferase
MSEDTPGDPPSPALPQRLAAMEAELARIGAMLTEVREVGRQIRQLVGPFAVPIPPDELLVQTLFGVKFYVPARDQLMTPQLVVYRQWEAQLSRLMLHLAPAGSVFVDVGANFGYFTCLLAASMGQMPGSRVIAVEPNPHMLRLLAMNIRVNWSMAPVRVVPAALADEPGTRALLVPRDSAGNAALQAADPAAPADAPPVPDTAEAVEVPVMRLDDVLRDEARVDLLKVDVEGFETAVFQGGAETLRRPGLKIVFEWAQTQMTAAGYRPPDLLDLLRAQGFVLFDAERYLDTSPPVELSDAAILGRRYCNLLALRP